MLFEEFQNGHCGGHLGHPNRMLLAILKLHVSSVLPTKFWLNPTYHREQMSFEVFQDGHHGGHLGYWNGKIKAVLNLHVAPMPPTKFQFKPTDGLAGDVVWRISRWLLWRPSWIFEKNDFSNTESPCRPNGSHQVWGQSDLGFGTDVVWRFSRWPLWRPSWTPKRNNFSNSE